MEIRLGDADLYLKYMPVTASTNADALRFAAEEKPTRPHLFVAEEQTAGRGRLGRSFLSPRGGVYMTLLLPTDNTPDVAALTSYTAVCVARVIERMTPLKPKIKWVNDVYIGDKKLAGILVQGAISPDSGKITHAAIGIGINTRGKSLPEEISDIATTLEAEGAPLCPEELWHAVAEEILDNLADVGKKDVACDYRRRNYLDGAKITVHKPDATYPATVIGIGDACELIIRTKDGRTEALTTGDVTVRKQK